MVLAVGRLSPVIACMNDFSRGRSQPFTHVDDRKLSVQRLSQRTRVFAMAHLNDRMNYCGKR